VEDDMSNWAMLAIVAATAGCAGMRTAGGADFASGHWIGEIDRDGSARPLALDIARENGAYRGQVQSVAGVGTGPLENVEVQGDRVRFETDELRFSGRVKGSTLSGTVTHKPEDAPVGEFSVKSQTPAFWPSSEWSPDVLE
jgi:hypothetical protein